MKYGWYENWDYPNEFRKINGTKLEPLEIRMLFERIRNIIFRERNGQKISFSTQILIL